MAQQNYQAALQMFEHGTIAREEDILAKEAEIDGLEGQVVEANLHLEDSTLRAPYDGVIAQRFVEQGQNVRAKDRVIAFQDVDEIDIAVDVPEAVMATDLRSADIVQMLASFNAAPGLLFPVHIKEIAQRADPITQTFTIRVGMKSPPALNLLPGMTGTVTLTYRRASILGGQISEFIDQRSVGKELLGTFNTQLYGARFTASYADALLFVEFDDTAAGTAIRNPFGGDPTFNSLMISNFNQAHEKSYGIGITYDFSKLGLTGVRAFGAYAYGSMPAGRWEEEINATLDYRVTAGALKNCWLRLG